VPDFCSCGAQLPPDARFCHKCGKPLFTVEPEPVIEPEPLVPPPPPRVVPDPALSAPGFHNPVAVRVAVSMAGMAAVLSLIPYVGMGMMVWQFAAGFLAAVLYTRRTGQRITARGGAKIGWMTGVIDFAVFALIFTLQVVSVGLQGFVQQQVKQMREFAVQAPWMQEGVKMLETPAGVSIMIVSSLLSLLFMTAVFSVAGGALGARMGSRD
jgi:hypothetical protein